MQRYFVKEKIDDCFLIDNSDSYHIIKVMRMKEKDKIEVVYEGCEYLCEIVSRDLPIKCKIIAFLNNNKQLIPRVFIAQSLVKEQKMDYILQKSTELGVDTIIPLNSERSVIKITDKENKKVARWQKVVKEASEQSKRCTIPKVENIENLSDLVNRSFDYKFICSVNEKAKTIKSVLSNVNISDTILFVVGPEGGLSKREEDFLLANGFTAISFGSNVLRTETASLFVLSAVNYEFMR